jgi:ankyrin repeat protein
MKVKIDEAMKQKSIRDAKEQTKNVEFDNKFALHVVKLRNQADEQRRIVMRMIAPLDEQETNLQRLIESTGRQRMVLQAYLESHDEVTSDYLDFQDVEDIKRIYEIEFKRLRDDLLVGFKERLKSRDYIFDINEDDFVKLNDDVRSKLIRKYESNIDTELSSHTEEFIRNLDSIRLFLSIQKLEKKLSDEVERLNDELDKIIERKIPHGTKYNNEEEKFFARRRKLQSKKEQYQKNREESLSSLCFRGDLDKIKLLLEKDIELINMPNQFGDLPLHRACQGGHLNVVQYLFSLGAKRSSLDEKKTAQRERFSAYHYAAMLEKTEILEFLCAQDNYRSLNILSAKGRTLLHSAVHSNRPDTVKWLLSKKYPTKPAVVSWFFNDENLNVNSQDTFTGATPLHLAAWLGYDQIAKDLIEYGANVQIQNFQGETPLVQALMYRQVDVLKVFFRKGYCLTQEEVSNIFEKNEFPEETKRFFRKSIEEAFLGSGDSYLSDLKIGLSEKKESEHSTRILRKGDNKSENETQNLSCISASPNLSSSPQ